MQTIPLIALFDNLEAGDGELTFGEGDILIPTGPAGEDEEWVQAMHLLGGPPGLVPQNYVKELSMQSNERLVAEFEAKADEENELNFFEGQVLWLLHRVSEDWLLCRNDAGNYGLVPCNYVRKEGSEDEPAPAGHDDDASQSGLLAELKLKARRKPSLDEDPKAVAGDKPDTRARSAGTIEAPAPRPSIPKMPAFEAPKQTPKQTPKQMAQSNDKVEPTLPERKTAAKASPGTHSNSTASTHHQAEEVEVVKATPKPEAPKFTLPQVELKSASGRLAVDKTPSGEAAKMAASMVAKTKQPEAQKVQQPETDREEAKPSFEPRIWTSKTGSSKQEATFSGVSADDQKVLLKKPDGRTIQVPLNTLSPRDVEYVNRVEGRTVHVYSPPSTPVAKAASASPEAVNYSVDGFNWLSFLGNNTSTLSKDAIRRYAGIFAQAGIGQHKLLELEGKKVALLGIKIADMDEVMGAIRKMQDIINKDDDIVNEKARRLSISSPDRVSPRAKAGSSSTTIMIPQFAIEQGGRGGGSSARSTVTIEKRVEDPVVSKVIEPQSIVYEVRSHRNEAQPNSTMTLAPRPLSPGVVHRSSLGYYPQMTGQPVPPACPPPMMPSSMMPSSMHQQQQPYPQPYAFTHLPPPPQQQQHHHQQQQYGYAQPPPAMQPPYMQQYPGSNLPPAQNAYHSSYPPPAGNNYAQYPPPPHPQQQYPPYYPPPR